MGVYQALERLISSVLVALATWTGSIGLAVVLLTVLIRVILHPLSRWSLKSMKRLQTLAPQMEVLRRKYKDNKEQLNAEIMNLYRSSGVNPFGGCLPIIVQFPVLIALYNVLRKSPLFKGQTFLGMPLDVNPNPGILQHPVLILIPLLMGITTYVQQKMTITDPQQAKIAVFMPLMLIFFSLSFPVGISVYWIVSTMLGILEYLVVVGRPLRPAPAIAKEATVGKVRRSRSGKGA